MASKKKVTATVNAVRKLAPGIHEMWLKTELAKEAKAGQFIALYTGDASMLLPRPISICEVKAAEELLRLVYREAGHGTRKIAECRQGDQISILGILGNGYPIEKAVGKEALLMGGGIGIPPLLELAKELSDHTKLTIILGYRDAQLFLKEDFEQYGKVLIATEDGSVGTRGNVMDAVKEYQTKEKLNYDIIFSCGPMPMLCAIKRFAKEKEIPAYLSMEERMACGVGACLGCVCRTTHVDEHSHVHNTRICTEGPVFLADDVAILPEDKRNL